MRLLIRLLTISNLLSPLGESSATGGDFEKRHQCTSEVPAVGAANVLVQAKKESWSKKNQSEFRIAFLSRRRRGKASDVF